MKARPAKIRIIFRTRIHQMRTATMEIVCEGRVFILGGVYTHDFYTSSEEKGQRPPNEEGEKRIWCGACEATLYEGLQTEKEPQPAPSHASRCPIRGKKLLSISIRPRASLIDFMRFSRISLPRTSSTFLEQVEISGIHWWWEVQILCGKLQGNDVERRNAPRRCVSHSGLSFFSGTFVRFAKVIGLSRQLGTY